MESKLRIAPLVWLEKESVEMLLQEYDLPLQIEEKVITFNGEEIKRVDYCHISVLSSLVWFEEPDNTMAQVAKLALLMNSCMDGKIAVNCTISHPKKGEVKGTEKKVEIKNKLFNEFFKEFLHRYIYEMFYSEINSELNDLINVDIADEHKINIPLCGKFDEECLNKIIQFQESRNGNLMNKYASVGRVLYFIQNKLNEYNLFDGWNKTKIYSFLYDWGVLQGIFNDIGKGFKGTIGKEKYTEVRNRIDAYIRRSKKI